MEFVKTAAVIAVGVAVGVGVVVLFKSFSVECFNWFGFVKGCAAVTR